MSTDDKANPVQGVVITHPSLIRVYCKKCGSDVTDTARCCGASSCPTCDAWTTSVEAREVPMFNFSA